MPSEIEDSSRVSKIRRVDGEQKKAVSKTHNDIGEPFTTNYFPYTKGQLERSLVAKKYENHKQAWNIYYQSNTVNGYKDRHYILREFIELNNALQKAKETNDCQPVRWMEIGCGVGNAVMPALKEFSALHVCGFDISSVAIKLFQKKIEEEKLGDRVKVCVTNLSEEHVPRDFIPQPSSPESEKVDFASIIFVLSAVPPSKHGDFLKRSRSLMKKGGTLFFRDYYEQDMAQKRFSTESKINDSTYFRSDGTLSHFFTKEEIARIFLENGFSLIEEIIIEREVENRKDQNVMHRRWYQARFKCV